METLKKYSYKVSYTYAIICILRSTVEPLITDTPNSGHPLYNGQPWIYQPIHVDEIDLQLPNSGQSLIFRQWTSAAYQMYYARMA